VPVVTFIKPVDKLDNWVPFNPLAVWAEVATIVPVPVADNVEPDPTTIVADVLVPLVIALNADEPPPVIVTVAFGVDPLTVPPKNLIRVVDVTVLVPSVTVSGDPEPPPGDGFTTEPINTPYVKSIPTT
jgi:hypothetical protein